MMRSPCLPLALIATSILAGGCKNERSNERSGNAAERPTARDNTEKILVLDAALEKARGELAALEAARPRDERAISEKRHAIEAVEQTLANLRRREQGRVPQDATRAK